VKIYRLLLILLTLAAGIGFAHAQTEISIQYSQAGLYKPMYDTLIEHFQKAHPGIKVVTRPAATSYEDLQQRLLRGAITGNLPDMAFPGLNQVRVLVDNGIAQPLDAFVSREPQWEARGYSSRLMSLARFGEKTYGLPVIVSTPVVYFNADLVRRAGGDPDAFPTTWDALLALAGRINALGDGISGVYYGWSVTGNWMWQALVNSHGGRMLTPDEKKVAFDGPAGIASMNLLARMASEGGQRNLDLDTANQQFLAGKIGMVLQSPSRIAFMEKAIGKRFDFRTARFPTAKEQGLLPAGGAAVVMFARDAAKQAASWEFMKFVTSAESAPYIVRKTGYAPGNQLAVTDPRYLGDFLKSNPAYHANVSQLGMTTTWTSYPGSNGLKIMDVIKDTLQGVCAGTIKPDAGLSKMSAEVQALLPKT
jgi:multiple sugar transport system substrate-binding protein